MNFRCKTALVVAALLTLVGSPTFASTPEETFVDGTRHWIAAYNAGDTEAIIALYDKDAVVMPPDTPAATGHEAIRAFLIGDIKSSKDAGISLRIDSDSAGAADDTGWHSGTFSVIDKDGKVVGTGKFLEVLQRKDDKWLIIRDIWNNDAAAAAPAAASANG
jgi:ketosteroid isomerase-like protein